MRNESSPLASVPWLAVVLLAGYFTLRFPFEHNLSALGSYGSYCFEAIFVLAVGIYYRKWIEFRLAPIRRSAIGVIAALIAGYGIYELASPLKLTIPFNLHDAETLIFILFIGPVLEELVFRMALWQLIQRIFKNQWFTLVATSAAFSFAHFWAFFHVPGAIQPFIVYQTLYTLLLGGACGIGLVYGRSVLVPIVIHLGFNLGFVLGWRLMHSVT